MKKRIRLFTLLLSTILSFSVFSQGWCYLDTSDSYWKISESLYGSKRLSDCHPNAYYNCHGFVISYFENGCTSPSWIGSQLPAPYICPNAQGIKSATAYQESGKYVPVCSEATANIAFYELIGDSHSAVKEVSGGGTVVKYLSKYGFNGPLVAHNLTGSWYHLTGKVLNTPVQFWSYVGPINGNPNIVGLSPVTFTVSNIPGVTYSWSIPSGSSKIYISSSSTQNTVTLTPTHVGPAVLRLITSSACDNRQTIPYLEIPLNIQTNICLQGLYSNAGINNQNLNTANNVVVGGVSATVYCPNATSYSWQKTSGNINGWIPSGSTVSFTMSSGGSISFLVTAKNGSTTLATRNVTFYNFGSFMVYPNPSATSLSVDLNEHLEFDLVLESFDGSTKREIPKYKGGSTIDISDLKAGDYALSIFFERKLIYKQRVLISMN